MTVVDFIFRIAIQIIENKRSIVMLNGIKKLWCNYSMPAGEFLRFGNVSLKRLFRIHDGTFDDRFVKGHVILTSK